MKLKQRKREKAEMEETEKRIKQVARVGIERWKDGVIDIHSDR